MYEYPLLPPLPPDVALDCLFRVPLQSHRLLQQVCRSWKSSVTSPDFLSLRRKAGLAHQTACLIQVLSPNPSTCACKSPTLGLSIYDPSRGMWERPPPVPDFPSGLPLFCQCVSVESSLIVLGGWDPATGSTLRSVYILNVQEGRWRRGADMPRIRSLFACGSVAGRVVVAGGHDNDKNALRTVDVYDMEANEWDELPNMARERDECKGIAVGGVFVVVGGYPTNQQGRFQRNAEWLDVAAGKWTVMHNFWEAESGNMVSMGSHLYAVSGGKLLRRRNVLQEDKLRWEEVCSVPGGMKSGGAILCALGGHSIFVCSNVRPYSTSLLTVSEYGATWQPLEADGGFTCFSQSSCSLEM